MVPGVGYRYFLAEVPPRGGDPGASAGDAGKDRGVLVDVDDDVRMIGERARKIRCRRGLSPIPRTALPATGRFHNHRSCAGSNPIILPAEQGAAFPDDQNTAVQ